MLNQSGRSKTLLLLREAFSSLLPIVLVMNILVLISGLPKLIGFSGITEISFFNGEEVSRLYFFLIPLFLNLSLSTLLAKERGLDQIGSILITMVCFFRVSGYLSIEKTAQIVSHQGSILSSIPATFFAVIFLNYFSKFPQFRLIKYQSEINPRLRKTLNLLIPGLLTILAFEIVHQFLKWTWNIYFLSHTSINLSVLKESQPIPELILYKAISQLTWFFGIHGEHSAEGLFRLIKDIPPGESSGIRMKVFHDVFMNIGGTGSTFIIPILISFTKKTRAFQSIAQLSLPFAFFNVNEILLFGLPVILNPIFFIPFFLTPFINMAIALLFIHYGVFEITQSQIHWMSPPLYSAYTATGGSGWAVFVNLLCIGIDGFVYYPFLWFAQKQFRLPSDLTNLLGEDAYTFVDEEIEIREERQFLTKQLGSINSAASTQKVLSLLRGGTFIVYFQPKIDSRLGQLVSLEALIRFRSASGEVIPPTFLPLLCELGLSKAVDKKVVDLVIEQILQWRSQGFIVPPISINFDKDFLLDQATIKEFILRSKQHGIQFYIEITEHTYTIELEILADVVRQLRAAGHWISIDDFGAGYSSLTTLVTLEADEIKLDRNLVVFPKGEEKRGEILLASSVQLCKDLGFSVVAEGVETLAQLNLVQRCGVDIVQGYLTGYPMNPEKASLLFSRKEGYTVPHPQIDS